MSFVTIGDIPQKLLNFQVYLSRYDWWLNECSCLNIHINLLLHCKPEMKWYFFRAEIHPLPSLKHYWGQGSLLLTLLRLMLTLFPTINLLCCSKENQWHVCCRSSSWTAAESLMRPSWSYLLVGSIWNTGMRNWLTFYLPSPHKNGSFDWNFS